MDVALAEVPEELTAQLQERGGTWALYQCQALDSAERGQWRALKVGPECTFAKPPERYPDAPGMTTGWKYLYKLTVSFP